ncbi:MAG: hypothetical protein JWL69_3966 [Phycisphaerales bacterium]|nr:hypothetical protein [Phycisphaerales bacterium]
MAKGKSKAIKLNEQYDGDEFKGYRKYIYGRMFTLGKDETKAKLKATALVAAGEMLKALKKDWTEDVVRQAYALAIGDPLGAAGSEQAEASTNTSAPASVNPRRSTTVTLHDAIAQYVESLKINFAQKEFGPEQHLSLVNRTACLKHVFADNSTIKFFALPESQQKLIEDKPIYMEKPPLTNKSIAEVGEDDLATFKTFLLKRPASRRTGKPLGVQTIRNNLQAAHRFFKFAKKQKLWAAFDEWEDTFKFRRNQKRNIMTAAEKTKLTAEKDHMTIVDMKLYWSLSTERTRVFQALCFWCAWTQVELATFRKVEFYREKGEAFIDKSRSKTGESGKWWIPEPVAEMVEKYMKKTTDDPKVNPDGLAFLTSDGRRLVHHGDGTKKRSDLVANYLWKPIQYAANKGGRSHSFKWFRKTMPNMIGQRTGNRYIAKAALAQRVQDVADTHYINPLTEQFIAAAKKLWADEMHKVHVFKTDEEQIAEAKRAVSDYLKQKNRKKMACGITA